MSKNKLIALAIAAALVSPAAYAVEVDLPTDETVVPTNAIVDETVAVTVASAIEITAGASDSYLARTTGYSVVVTLDNGATFAQAVTDADIALIGGTAAATVAGGGGVGDSSVTISVTPATAVEEGDGFSFNAGSFVVDTVEFLANGMPLTIDVLVRDPGTGFTLETTDDTTLVTAIQGWEGDFLAGDLAIRIDVGSNSGKTQFSGDGSINNPAPTSLFRAGAVDAGLVADLTDAMGMDETLAEVSLVVSGEDFAAFERDLPAADGIFLSSDVACGVEDYAFTISADQNSATLEDNVTVANVAASPNICFLANGEVIVAQDLSATLVITQDTFQDSPPFSGELTSLQYNGAVTRVMFFNPASNIDQQSYLRISNTSGTAGLFTIDGTCDDGTDTNPVTFTLEAGTSKLLTSQDIENGNATKGLTGATGSCTANGAAGVTGKQRLTITGEVGGMEVQNFLRNGTSAGSINTNVNNDDN